VITVGPAAAGPVGADRHVGCDPADGLAARWNAGATAVGTAAALFLRASALPVPSLVAAHAVHHARGSHVVVGAEHALPADDSLASSWAALEARDANAGVPALAPGWAAVPVGNVSARMEALSALGGFQDGEHCSRDLVRRASETGRAVTYDAGAAVAVLVRATCDEVGQVAPPARRLLAALERRNQRRLWAKVLRRGLPPAHGPDPPGVHDRRARSRPAGGPVRPDRAAEPSGGRCGVPVARRRAARRPSEP
jgi:hypothetical protein